MKCNNFMCCETYSKSKTYTESLFFVNTTYQPVTVVCPQLTRYSVCLGRVANIQTPVLAGGTYSDVDLANESNGGGYQNTALTESDGDDIK